MENRFYQSSDLDIERLTQDVERILLAQGYQVQHIGNKEHMTIQLRKGADLEALIGMQAALTVTLQRASNGVMAIVGQQQWIDKAAIGAAGMLFLWPLAVTAGVGILRQAGLADQVLRTLDTAVLQQQADVHIGPLPSQEAPFDTGTPPWSQQHPASTSTNAKQCLYCQEINDADARYCTHCGKPMNQATKRCTQCQTEVKAHAAFCSKCGTPFAQS